jgi:hypothetical protein
MLSHKHIAYSLCIAATVIVAVFLALSFFFNSDSLQDKLRTTIQQQTEGQVHYQKAEFSVLPSLSITLNQVEFDFSDQAQGSIDSLQVYPELWPLLTGQVHLSRVVIEAPDIVLDLPVAYAEEDENSPPLSFASLHNSLDKGLEPLLKFVPEMNLAINKGALEITKDGEKLNSIKDIALRLSLSISTSGSSQVELQASTTGLVFHHEGQDIITEDLAVKGTIKKEEHELAFVIDELTLGKPALNLQGDLIVGSTSPGFELDLYGEGIDVDAIRRTALTLANESTPVKEIFNYLRGGRVPQISFHSQGETAAQLGALKNIVIKGQLQTGAVSIPEIELDLTELEGDVVIRDGVLEGSKISTRLEGSYGHDGLLKVALGEGNDLFQLELMLSANLPQAQHILKRIIEESEFAQLVDNITNLQGTSTGKLILGDRLNDINARVDISDLNLTAEYQGLPFPVGVTEGRLSFEEEQIEFKNLSGTFGRSEFSGVTCTINWEEVPTVDLDSGKFGLVLDELYPWASSFDATKKSLHDINKITGRLDLATLSLNGAIGATEAWQMSGAGTINVLEIETSLFPTRIELAEGNFTLENDALAFHNLKTIALDADLVLSGTLKGLPLKLDQVELSLDGMMGKDSVAWLQDTLVTSENPGAYTLRTPLTFDKTKIAWQPDSTTSIEGAISVGKGPKLTLDMNYRPEQLQINQLLVRDQYSDAKITYAYGQEETNFGFTGSLRHETLEALFVDKLPGKGHLVGDFSLKTSLTKQTETTAKGHLNGAGVVITLPSRHDVAIDKITLEADGSEAQAEAKALSWNGFVWDPVNATIDFSQDKIAINISEAKLCGIGATGALNILGSEHVLDFTLEGEDLDVVSSYSCLTEGKVKMTGTMDFSGKVSSQGTTAELVSNLNGPIEMTFHNGMIEQSKLLARTLEVLNVTEIVKGRLPDLARTAFAYSTIVMQGDLRGEKLIISKVQMDAETLDALGQGEIDFRDETIDVELLAAPFKTVDTVVQHIPGVNYLLAGSLVAIPVSIKGKYTDPNIRIMSASSVGSSLLSLGGRVIKSPLKLIETMTPGTRETKE